MIEWQSYVWREEYGKRRGVRGNVRVEKDDTEYGRDRNERLVQFMRNMRRNERTGEMLEERVGEGCPVEVWG